MGNAEKQEKHLQRIKSSVRNLITILDDFLSLDKMETGKVRLHKQEIDFGEFIKDLLMEVKPWVKEKQNIAYDHCGGPTIYIDPHMTRNVLLNLLSNALKYSPAGSTVHLNTQNEAGALVIQVKDEGIGIPEEDQKNMFTRFYRASNASGISGTGLGLTIVKRYLDIMGGTIKFTSEAGKGATFRVTIPISRS